MFWLWLLSVLAGGLTMFLVSPVLSDPITWGIGFFAMWVTSYPWARRKWTTHGFWTYTLFGGGGALVTVIAGTIFQRL